MVRAPDPLLDDLLRRRLAGRDVLADDPPGVSGARGALRGRAAIAAGVVKPASVRHVAGVHGRRTVQRF